MDIKRFALDLEKRLAKSDYEVRYMDHNGIDCDPGAIRSVVLDVALSISPDTELLERLIGEIGADTVDKICSGDEDACRMMVIEKMARQAAAEMCVNGKYEVETFKRMAYLPIEDFKLVTKRVVELVSIANDVSNQAVNIGVAGL